MKKEGFIKLYNWIFTELKLTGNEAILYALLYSLADDNGICKPSNTYLADHFNVGERTVQRWLDHLQQSNHIQRLIIDVSEHKSYRKITVMKKLSGCQGCHTNKNNNNDIYNSNNNSITARQDCHPKEVLKQIGRFFNQDETEYLLSVSEKEISDITNDYSDKHYTIAKRYFMMKDKYFNY